MLWKLVENVKYEDIYEVSGHPGCPLDFFADREFELLDTPTDIFVCLCLLFLYIYI